MTITKIYMFIAMSRFCMGEQFIMMHSGCLGDRSTGLDAQILAPKKHFPIFFSCISAKIYIKAANNNFTMHLIILKWIRHQKMQAK